ncbi:MAG: VWA domain-containing protein [Phycisphaeraceae bacterium]|nr:MAG: VWA domain-containing protein [Phycisphaeraceae bacterium]
MIDGYRVSVHDWVEVFAFDRLADPLFLLVLPILLVVLFWSWRRKSPAVLYSSFLPLEEVPRTARQRMLWIPRVLRVLALTAAVVALARPQSGHAETVVEGEGVAMMLVVDRSRSMEAPMPYKGRIMTRLDVVKDIIRAFVLGDGEEFDGRTTDLIGLISFAGYAQTHAPLIRSPQTIVDLAAKIDFIPTRLNRELDGTAIGEGIALAASRLIEAEGGLDAETAGADDERSSRSNVIILLTDGEENRGEIRAPAASELCRELGIRLYTIAIASPDEIARTRMLPAQRNPFVMLDTIAKKTGGRFFLAADGDALNDVYREIDRLEKTTIESREYTRWDERFLPYAVLALILLIGEILLASTLCRRSP